MIKKYLANILLIGSFSLISCQTELNESELMEYINDPDNELVQIKEINKVQYKITFKPVSLLKVQDSEINSNSVIDNKEPNYNKYNYFTLNMSVSGKDIVYGGSTNFQDFSENLKKFSFSMNDYVILTTDGGDTIALADYYTPNLFGMSKSTQMLLAFEKPKKDVEELKISIKELGLGTGNQQFIFKQKNINKIPGLKAKI